MSAELPAFDFAPLLAAPLTPTAKLLYIHLKTQGGRVENQTRSQIAQAIGCDEKTVTRSSRELEDKRWTTGSNSGQGRPKAYQCSGPAADVLSKNGTVSFLGRTKCPFCQNDPSQKGTNVLSGDPAESIPLTPQTTPDLPRATLAATAHDVGNGQGVRPAHVDSMVLSSSKVYISNRSAGDSIEKPPVKEKSKPSPDRPELRAKLPAQDVETLEQRLTQDFRSREATLPAVGEGRHPIALLLLNHAIKRGFDYRDVQVVMDEVWHRRYEDDGEQRKPEIEPMRHWGYLLYSLKRELVKKRPPQRETRNVEPQKVAVGQTAGQHWETPDMLEMVQRELKAAGGAGG